MSAVTTAHESYAHAAISNSLNMVRVRLNNHLVWLENEIKTLLMSEENGGRNTTNGQLPNAMDAVPREVHID